MGGHMPLELSAPKMITFIISAVLVVVAVVVRFANIDLPILPTHGFAILLLGYLVLAAGNLLRNV
jgi:hypothetical protein